MTDRLFVGEDRKLFNILQSPFQICRNVKADDRINEEDSQLLSL